MNTQRFRLRFIFWLDMNKPDEEILAEEIENLKQHRSFAKTVRDGIRLICDLKAGKTDVLFELFPKLKTTLMSAHVQGGGVDIKDDILRLERLILEQGGQTSGSAKNVLASISSPPALQQTGGVGLKQMNVTQFEAPTFDDDDDLPELDFQKADNSNVNANANFLAAMQSLAGN